MTTLDTGRWVIPKGWPWPDYPDYEAAAGEAREEAGVEGIAYVDAIGAFTYEKRHKNGASSRIEVTVFLLEVTRILKSWPEKKRRQRAWLDPSEAAGRVQEVELSALLSALPDALQRPTKRISAPARK